MAIFRDEVMKQRVGYANFADFCADDLRRSGYDGTTRNPNADPDFSYSRKKRLERLLGLDWYYGGWMEDRSIVWSDTYLKETGNFLHLGVDCSVKAGTEVLAVRDGLVVWSGSDSPLEGGWGGHVVQLIEHNGEPFALIYAHLKKGGLPQLGYLRNELDGYGKVEHMTYWARRCPDPTPLLF